MHGRNEKPERFHTLDGMRGIAAIMVALFHFGIFTTGIIPSGFLAVDFFFALSGFVIALSYSGRLQQGMTPASFFQIRFIRLYPLYALGFLLGLAVVLVMLICLGESHASGAQLITSAGFGIFMLPTPFDALFRFNTPSWSLLNELLVNILFAVTLFRMRSRRLLALVGVCAMALFWSIGPPDFINVGVIWKHFLIGMARTLFSFGVGILLFRHLPLSSIRTSWWAVLPVAALAGILCVEVVPAMRAAWQLVAVFSLLPVTLAAGIMFDMPQALRRACGVIGDASYAVYAIHYPAAVVMAPLVRKLHLPVAAGYLAFCAVVLAGGIAAARYVDPWARSHLYRLASRWRVRAGGWNGH